MLPEAVTWRVVVRIAAILAIAGLSDIGPLGRAQGSSTTSPGLPNNNLLPIDSLIAAEEAKLIASNPDSVDLFGFSVSISGDTAVIGAIGNGSSGSAFVFVRDQSGWVPKARLWASTQNGQDEFGTAVAVSGDTIVVGARQGIVPGVGRAGAAYVFVRPGGGWVDMTETAMLSATNASDRGNFGNAVAVSGDTVVIGDNYRSHAYVFAEPGGGWTDMTETARLTASDLVGYDSFGSSVAIWNDTIVVASFHDSHSSKVEAGSAYVFDKPDAGWADMAETAKLIADDAGAGDNFGWSVSISGDTVVVGAPQDDDANPTNAICSSGSAYVFTRTGSSWSEQAKLTAAEAACGNWFGMSVSVSGETIVIGGERDALGSTGSGAAYVYLRAGTSWSQKLKLTSSDAQALDKFGRAVSISGDRIVIGADRHNALGINMSGAAYAFRLNAFWMDLEHALGGAHGEPVLTGTGMLVGGSPIELTLTNAPANTSAVLVIGATALNAPFKGGLMVPEMDLLLPLSTGPTGEISLGSTWPAGIPAGVNTYFQYWIVDPAGPFGLSASNALSGTTP